ncbi:MAG: IS110 family transposase [Verrucomicrobia bacterium]|nr:IS110 family transposase [Verrucomicrobiota bacterium]
MKIEKEVLYLGLDVHAENIAVAIAEAGRDGEVRNYGTISSGLHSVEKLLNKLGHPGKELRVCYEAGPCGFVLARFLKKKGIACDVIAPSLTPKGSGDKIKTDRRDARMLARLHRAGELTAVHVPDERDEAIRDLCRARTDAVHDRRSGRNQLKAFLLRNGYRYSEKTSWGVAHMRYLRELVLPHPAMKIVLEEYLQGVDAADERIERLEVHMKSLLEDWHMKPVVLALMAFRGYQIVAAMITVSEIGDIHRFAHPRQLMAYLGLVPSESSSGGSRAQGSITKCGNGHLRWIFVECGQHYRLPPKVSQELTTRQEAIPKAHSRAVKEISWRCQNRLYEKGRKLAARGKTRQKVQTALARELSAFVWEVMRAVTPKADGTQAVSTARVPKTEEIANQAAKKKSRNYSLKKK